MLLPALQNLKKIAATSTIKAKPLLGNVTCFTPHHDVIMPISGRKEQNKIVENKSPKKTKNKNIAKGTTDPRVEFSLPK